MSPEQALLNQLSTEISILHGSIVELSEAVSKLAESVPEKAAQDVPSARSNTNSPKDIPSSKSTYKFDPGNGLSITEWFNLNCLKAWYTGPVNSKEIDMMMRAVSYDDFERSLRDILLMRGLPV